MCESFFEGDPCAQCNLPLEPRSNFFVVEIGPDLLWACPNCGLKYDVEHECNFDFCTEVLTVAK